MQTLYTAAGQGAKVILKRRLVDMHGSQECDEQKQATTFSRLPCPTEGARHRHTMMTSVVAAKKEELPLLVR